VELRRGRYNPRDIYDSDEQIRWAIDLIERDFFSMLEPGVFRPLIQSLLSDDSYMLLADFRSYIETQDRVDAAYRDRSGWLMKTILNVARAGKFSSDRTIQEYASEIWHVDPCQIVPQTAAADGESDIRVLDSVLKGKNLFPVRDAHSIKIAATE
jgi:starch phosphorylase